MAFIAPDQREEEEANGQPPGANDTTLSETGAGSLSGSAASSAGPSKSGGSASSGGRFVGIDKYLSANQGSVPKYAEKLTGNVNQTADAARGTADRVESGFLGAVGAATPKADPGLAQKSLRDIAGDKTLKTNFLAQRDAKYGGPTDISEAEKTDLQSARGKAESRLGNLVDPNGLRGEVEQASTNPTLGKTTFNTALVSGSDDAQNIFRQNRDTQLSSVNERLQQLADKQKAAVAKAQEDAANVSRETRGRITTEADKLRSDLKSREQFLNTKRDVRARAADAALANQTGRYDPSLAALELYGSEDPSRLNNFNQQRDQLGSLQQQFAAYLQDPNLNVRQNAEQYAYTANQPFNPTSFVRERFGPANAASVASVDDYAQLDALNALSGEDLKLPISAATRAQAGLANDDALNFDYEAAAGDLQGRLAAIRGVLENLARAKANKPTVATLGGRKIPTANPNAGLVERRF